MTVSSGTSTEKSCSVILKSIKTVSIKASAYARKKIAQLGFSQPEASMCALVVTRKRKRRRRKRNKKKRRGKKLRRRMHEDEEEEEE
ncbi:hypothetical protein ACLB2K_003811 [Fragaria x ananassa]